MFGMGLPELLVILLVCLLLFGPHRLSEIGKSLGEGIREFKKAVKESDNEPAKIKEDEKKN